MGVAIRTKRLHVPTERGWEPTFAFLLTAKLNGCSQEDETTSVIGSSWAALSQLVIGRLATLQRQ